MTPARFVIADELAKHEGDPTNDCWIWPGSKSKAGYGIRNTGRGTRFVHRQVIQLQRGHVLDPEEVVRHRECDNPPCFRPDHLRVGTQADNMQDKVERGRYKAWNTDLTACRRGHEYTPENTYHVPGTTTRQCKECKRTRGRDYDRTRRNRKREMASC